MTKIIKILNDYGYDVVIGPEIVYIDDSDGDIFISYDRDDRVIYTSKKGDIYIMGKFIQLIAEIEKE